MTFKKVEEWNVFQISLNVKNSFTIRLHVLISYGEVFNAS